MREAYGGPWTLPLNLIVIDVQWAIKPWFPASTPSHKISLSQPVNTPWSPGPCPTPPPPVPMGLVNEHKAKGPWMAFPTPPSSHPGSSDSLPTGGPDGPSFPTELWPEWQAVPRDSPRLRTGSPPSPGVSGSGLERGALPSSPHHPNL